MQGNKARKENVIFFIFLILFVTFVVARYFRGAISYYNTTPFAFSYKYGFISRGFLGSVWQMLDRMLPWNLMTYNAIYRFSQLITAVLFLLLLILFAVCIAKAEDNQKRNIRYLICFVSIFVFPNYLSEEIFGHLDIYLLCITVFCTILIIIEKAEWIIVPMMLVGVCVHHGFVFMNANVVLVLLFYKMVMRKGKQRLKYGILFFLSFIGVSVLFLYFEFFSHVSGPEIYEEVVETAKMLSPSGDMYNVSMVNHEILGEGVFMDEWKFHVYNYHDFPVFCIFFLPYIILGVSFFKKLLTGRKKEQCLAYLGIAAGAATVLPEMILKVDYGRYVFVTIFYYLITIIALIALRDQTVAAQFVQTKEEVKRKMPVPIILLLYPIFFVPFYDVIICRFTNKIVERLFPAMMAWLNSQ